MFEALVVKATPDSQVICQKSVNKLVCRSMADLFLYLISQEKLGQYLDVVETCLLKQIASRSQHFFEALTTLQVWCPPFTRKYQP